MGRGGFILSGPDSLYLCSSAPLPLVTTDMKPERTTCIDQAVVHKAKCVEGLCRGQQDPHGPLQVVPNLRVHCKQRDDGVLANCATQGEGWDRGWHSGVQ